MRFRFDRILEGVVTALFAAVITVGQPPLNLENKKVTSVHEKQPLGRIVDALIKDYAIPIGLEKSIGDMDEFDFDVAAGMGTYIVEDGSKSVSVVRQPVYSSNERLISVNVVNDSLKLVLDSVVRQMGDYTWDIEGGVVNIFPTSRKNTTVSGFLDTRLTTFTTGTNSMKFVGYSLANAPETLAYSRAVDVRFHYDSLGPIGRTTLKLPRKLDFKDASVRQILNRVAAEKKGGWILGRCRHESGTRTPIIDIQF